MVADRVTVISRPADSGADESREVGNPMNSEGEFTVEPFDKPTAGPMSSSTMREDAKEFRQRMANQGNRQAVFRFHSRIRLCLSVRRKKRIDAQFARSDLAAAAQ